VQITAGMTVEHNSFTEFEVQPTARATWKPTQDWMAWASISRAVRTPSLEEQTLSDSSFYVGSSEFRSETLWAYELGTRKMFGERVSTDLALFYNDYDHLRYADFNGTGYDLTNDAAGSAWGAELALDVQATDCWRLRSAYSFLRGKHEVDGVSLSTDDYHPEQQFNVRSYVDLGEDWELDTAFYAVDKMGPGYEIAEYTRVDVRLGWAPAESLDLYVGVQDVGHATRSEYDAFDNSRRSVYFGLSWHPE
jgi:iron complex outermembrane receptor protein